MAVPKNALITIVAISVGMVWYGVQRSVTILLAHPPTRDVEVSAGAVVILSVVVLAFLAAPSTPRRSGAGVAPSPRMRRVRLLLLLVGLAAVLIALPGRYSHQYVVGPGIQLFGDFVLAAGGAATVAFASTGRLQRSLERRTAKPQAAPRLGLEADHDATLDDSPLVKRIRTVEFPLALHGYAVDAVDEWLEAVAVAVAAATPGSFPTLPDRPPFKVSLRGYDRGGVDAFTKEVLRESG
jgi:hypothetical protein